MAQPKKKKKKEVQKGADVKGKGAFRVLTVCKTHSLRTRCLQQRKEKSPHWGESSLVPRHGLSPYGHPLFKVGEREVALKEPDRRGDVGKKIQYNHSVNTGA